MFPISLASFFRIHRHIETVLLLGCLLLFQFGCNSYPEPTRTYEYVEQYGRMSDAMDPVLSLVHIPPHVSLPRYKSCVVGNFAVGEEWIDNRVYAQRYATYLRMLLVRALEEEGHFEKVTLNPHEDVPQPSLRIEGMATVFRTGSGTQRFFSYFLPFLQSGGATDFQVEGRIYDMNTGQLLMEFVDRRRHLGNTPWLPNPKTFSDKFVMKHTVWETARSIASVLSGQQKAITDDVPAKQHEETQ